MGIRKKKRRKKVMFSGIISRKNIARELDGAAMKRLMPTLRPTRMAKHPSLPLIT